MPADRSEKPFHVYHMTDKENGQTLATVLRGLETGRSWGDIKQRIQGRYVQINGNLCLDPARRLTPRDVIKVWEHPLAKLIDATDIRVIHLDPHLIIIDKPPGVTSVRHYEERALSQRRRQLQPTLDELLPQTVARKLAPETPTKKPTKRSFPHPTKKDNRPMVLPTIIPVHRLDRDTSGLMIFARTKACAEVLARMFRKHSIDRRYRAVVYGAIEAQTIQSHLVRDIGGGRRGSTKNAEDPGAQLAITHVEVVEKVGDYTIVECRLETGRTHQIRIHLAETGHRICGEPIYVFDGEGKSQVETSGAPRQALHSWSLKLHHPISGEFLSFQSPWPPDLARWLRDVRK